MVARFRHSLDTLNTVRTDRQVRVVLFTCPIWLRAQVSKQNNLVFDHFGPNITAKHNRSRKATKSALLYQPYTE